MIKEKESFLSKYLAYFCFLWAFFYAYNGAAVTTTDVNLVKLSYLVTLQNEVLLEIYAIYQNSSSPSATLRAIELRSKMFRGKLGGKENLKADFDSFIMDLSTDLRSLESRRNAYEMEAKEGLKNKLDWMSKEIQQSLGRYRLPAESVEMTYEKRSVGKENNSNPKDDNDEKPKIKIKKVISKKKAKSVNADDEDDDNDDDDEDDS